MEILTVVFIVLIVIIVAVLTLVLVSDIQSSRVSNTRWEALGWRLSRIKQPVRMSRVKRMRKFWTRYIRFDDRSGAVTVGTNTSPGASGSSGSSVSHSIVFIANPFHGPDPEEFVTMDNAGTEAAEPETLDHGDPAGMSLDAWERLNDFAKANKPVGMYQLYVSKDWLGVLTFYSAFGPYETLAYLRYLRDLALAAEGKPTSGIDHKAAVGDGNQIDRISWRRKKRYAEATRHQG